MKLTHKIKLYLHAKGDGAPVWELKRHFGVPSSEILQALVDLQHEVIQGEDSFWYLDPHARLDEPEPEPSPETPSVELAESPAVVETVADRPDDASTQDTVIVAPEPKQPNPARATKAERMTCTLDYLKEQQALGNGPFTYQELAEHFGIAISTLRELRTRIVTKLGTDEQRALWNAMVKVQDRLENLKKSQTHCPKREDGELNPYQWREMKAYLLQQQALGRGPLCSRDLVGVWKEGATFKQTQRALGSLAKNGDDEGKRLYAAMVVPTYLAKTLATHITPESAPTPVTDLSDSMESCTPMTIESNTDTAPVSTPALTSTEAGLEAALREIRERLLPNHALAWGQTCNGVADMLMEYGIASDNAVIQQLRAMTEYWTARHAG